jgi:hypothetical protein
MCRPRSSNSEMHMEGVIELNNEMHLEAMIERIGRCIRRPRSSNSEIHLEVEMKRVWRCTWTPCSIEIGGVLGRGRSGAGRSGGRCTASGDSVHRLTGNCGDVES